MDNATYQISAITTLVIADTDTAFSNISAFPAVKFQIKTVPKLRQYLSKIRLAIY